MNHFDGERWTAVDYLQTLAIPLALVAICALLFVLVGPESVVVGYALAAFLTSIGSKAYFGLMIASIAVAVGVGMAGGVRRGV